MLDKTMTACYVGSVIAAVMLVWQCEAKAGDLTDAAAQIETDIETLRAQVQAANDALGTQAGLIATNNNTLNAIQATLAEQGLAIDTLRQRVEALEQQEPPPPVEEPEEPEEPPTEIVCTTVSEVEPGQSPFPGSDNIIRGPSTRIEAEDFDLGGEGIAYHDRDNVNTPGLYRSSEAVDIKSSSDSSGGQYAIGWGYTDEWLEYTVCVEPGIYDIELRVACGVASCDDPAHDGLDVFLDDVKLGSVDIPRTSQTWDGAYETVVMPGYLISGGHKILRVQFNSQPGDINWIEFRETDTAVNHPPTDILMCSEIPEDNPLHSEHCE